MILCIGPTPALQRVMVLRRVVNDAVNRAIKTLDGAAGKAVNVAKVLRVLGRQPVVVGFLGGDRGRWVRAILERLGVDSDFVEVEPPTRECVTVIDLEAGTQTELVEESQPVAARHYEELLHRIRIRIRPGECQALVMSGTIPPGGPADLYRQSVHLARASAALAVVDAHGPALVEALTAEPDLVKPNRTELAAMLGRELHDAHGIQVAMGDLHERGARRVVITSGAHAVFAFDGKTSWQITPPVIKAVNPIGSGDAFTAALVARLSDGADLGEACRWGAAAGAANALTLMAGDVVLADLQRLVAEVRVACIPAP